MRLIDADALLESLTVDPIGCAGCPEPEWIDELIDILDTAPTVEPQGDLSAELTLQTPQTYGKSINPSNAEVVENYISRADAVKTVIRMCSPICAWQVGTQQYPDCVVAEINALPSAEAEWIPCSERLPSEDGRYLVTYPLLRWQNNWISVMYYGKPLDPTQDVKGKCFYYSDSEWGDVVYDNILAWMPLPMPYREDGEE